MSGSATYDRVDTAYAPNGALRRGLLISSSDFLSLQIDAPNTSRYMDQSWRALQRDSADGRYLNLFACSVTCFEH